MVSVEEFVDRLCRIGSGRDRRGFPRRRRDRAILFRSIVQTLDSDRTYTEIQINRALLAWGREVAPSITTDHVTLRRLLVDYGHLERRADGSVYQLGFPAQPLAFELEVYDVDVRATTAAFRDQQGAQGAGRRSVREDSERAPARARSGARRSRP